MLFRKKKVKVKKQSALFAEAIREAGLNPREDELTINHELPRCYYLTEAFDIIFPLRFLRESRQLSYDKLHDFSFRGIHTAKRDWVNRFASPRTKITFTENGRRIEKDHFDRPYYQELANSKFTLCPAGDFKWTYRFLEAIMCRSIPVIEPGSDHSQNDGFTYYYSDKTMEELLQHWDESIVERNYKLFLKKHTLLDRFIFL